MVVVGASVVVVVGASVVVVVGAAVVVVVGAPVVVVVGAAVVVVVAGPVVVVAVAFDQRRGGPQQVGEAVSGQRDTRSADTWLQLDEAA